MRAAVRASLPGLIRGGSTHASRIGRSAGAGLGRRLAPLAGWCAAVHGCRQPLAMAVARRGKACARAHASRLSGVGPRARAVSSVHGRRVVRCSPAVHGHGCACTAGGGVRLPSRASWRPTTMVGACVARAGRACTGRTMQPAAPQTTGRKGRPSCVQVGVVNVRCPVGHVVAQVRLVSVLSLGGAERRAARRQPHPGTSCAAAMAANQRRVPVVVRHRSQRLYAFSRVTDPREVGARTDQRAGRGAGGGGAPSPPRVRAKQRQARGRERRSALPRQGPFLCS